MSQPARARSRQAARPIAPRGPRRVSGPVRRPVASTGAGAVALPGGRTAPRRRTTTAFDRVRALPDHRLVDGLLRSQAWIWLIGLALGGIVAMQVSLLKLNSGIGRAVETASTLERQNAGLEASIGRLSSGARIEQAAATTGMVMPSAGAVEYVRVRPGVDPGWAVRRMTAPSPAAEALMANGGIVPGSLVPPADGVQAQTQGQAPVATTTTTTPPAATTTTPPPAAATAPPAVPATATAPAPGAAAATATTGQG
jgi:hypothetical protein